MTQKEESWITFGGALLSIILFIIFILLQGCATKVSFSDDPGDVMLRQYPVPIEFSIAEGATNNTQ